MFSTIRQRFLLGVFILLTISIPVGAYLVSQNQTFKFIATGPNAQSSESIKERTKIIDNPASSKPTASPSNKQGQSILEELALELEGSPSPSPSSGDTTIATSFGPTLSLRAKLEGRKEGNQLTKLFVGIVEGTIGANPKFLLSFTVDLPENGAYTGLSLSGLNPGGSYTALLKGSAQIATSSAFVISPTETKLNADEPLNMFSGDLNDDNMINSSDYSLAQSSFGATPTSTNWRELADINKDAIVNTIDISIVAKNLGRIGASGSWTSPAPAASNSAKVTTPSSAGGYWIWVPELR